MPHELAMWQLCLLQLCAPPVLSAEPGTAAIHPHPGTTASSPAWRPHLPRPASTPPATHPTPPSPAIHPTTPRLPTTPATTTPAGPRPCPGPTWPTAPAQRLPCARFLWPSTPALRRHLLLLPTHPPQLSHVSSVCCPACPELEARSILLLRSTAGHEIAGPLNGARFAFAQARCPQTRAHSTAPATSPASPGSTPPATCSTPQPARMTATRPPATPEAATSSPSTRARSSWMWNPPCCPRCSTGWA
jgi:hypothetical protein